MGPEVRGDSPPPPPDWRLDRGTLPGWNLTSLEPWLFPSSRAPPRKPVPEEPDLQGREVTVSQQSPSEGRGLSGSPEDSRRGRIRRTRVFLRKHRAWEGVQGVGGQPWTRLLMPLREGERQGGLGGSPRLQSPATGRPRTRVPRVKRQWEVKGGRGRTESEKPFY